MIAVIIPAFNSARFLADTIASVRAQSAVATELVVVDDGSTDDTAAVAASLGADIRVVRQSNQGPGAARNAGLRATYAEFIAFLDADDLWPDGRLGLLHQRMIGNPSELIAIGRTQLVMESTDGGPPVPTGLPWHAPAFGSALIRRSTFADVGEINATLRLGEDLDWFIRARERAVPTAMLDDTTLLYRKHSASLTSGADAVQRNLLVALKRSLDRRRERTGS